MATMRPLKKTTVVIWSEADDPDRELFEVTLRLKVDPAATSAPGTWDWPALLDLPDRHHVQVQRVERMATMRPLKKTTVVIWSEADDPDRELSSLAREAECGGSYCAKSHSEVVQNPTADADWDGTEFFELGDGSALPGWAEHLREAPDFAAPLLRFIEERREDIEAVIEAAENPDVADMLGEQFWAAVAELKSELGAEAANASSDAAAEEAIEQAEAWVTQHVSSSSEGLGVAAILMTLGDARIQQVIAGLPARAAARG
jgi:hypothetical protein